MTNERICALRAMLIADGYPTAYSEITEVAYADNTYECDNGEYLVVDEDEAHNLADEYIRDSVWCFNPDFIIEHTDLPYEARDMVIAYQSDMCEGANDTIYALINDMTIFVDDAICADGVAHFLNTYDGEEYESGDYYIDRMNK